jgi:pSer/pThr/pTyr-binding forkhead associated (FHA) protein
MAWLALGTQTRKLADGETIVGSGADADWRVPTVDLMPRHFVLTVHGLNTSIRPASADIIVVVNGKQIDHGYNLLNEGDVILAGRGRFIYSDDTPSAQEVPSEPAVEAFLIDEKARFAHSLSRRSTTMGRDVSNSIVIPDPRASRFHAEVRQEAGGFALHSMGAAGTLRNGQQMRNPALLEDGDVIEIAFTTFRFTPVLPSGISVAPPAAGLNDAQATQPTGVGVRSTMESTTTVTTPPGPAAPLIVLIGLLVIGGIIVALAGLAWVGWGR